MIGGFTPFGGKPVDRSRKQLENRRHAQRQLSIGVVFHSLPFPSLTGRAREGARPGVSNTQGTRNSMHRQRDDPGINTVHAQRPQGDWKNNTGVEKVIIVLLVVRILVIVRRIDT